MDNIKKVEVFKHEPTGQLFEKFEDYEKCRTKYEERESKRQEKARIEREWSKIINQPRLTATSIHDFIKKIKDLLTEYNGKQGVVLKTFDIKVCRFEEKVSANNGSPIGYPAYDENDPSNKDSWSRKYYSYPAWRVDINGTLDDRGRNRNYSYLTYEVACPFLEGSVSKIPGFKTGTSSGVESFNVYAYVFLYDLPLVYNQFKESFNKRDELEKSIIERKDAQQQYLNRREKFYEDNVTVKGVRKELDETIVKIHKLTEAKKLYESSLQSYKAELFEEYAGKEPWDFSIIDTLVQQLNLVKKDIKL